MRQTIAMLLLTLGLGGLLSACSDGSAEEQEQTPAQILAEAKTSLDETSGVNLALTTAQLPDGVDGVLEAVGVATNSPAFEGSITAIINSISVDVPVVSVDSVVYAKLPFTRSYAEINPADYGAPDPANLLNPTGGVSGWLTSIQDPVEGEQVRDGSRVLTSYTGTLPGDVVAAVIPSADETADFPTTFTLDDEGLLTSAQLVGPFYGDQGDVDYTVTLDDYGTAKDIVAP